MSSFIPFAVISTRWGNPYTTPPDDLPRILWAATIFDHADERQIRAEHAPDTTPGDVWSPCWTAFPKPIKRWAPERKAATRRANLRKRLDKKAPLFADQLFADELARRPDYFDAAAIAEADAAKDRDADA